MIGRLLASPVIFHRANALLDRIARGNLRCLRRAIRPAPGELVLDVGCGTGRYARLWACRYLGLDLDGPYIRYAGRRSPGRVLVGDAARLPVRDAAVDVTFCVGVLHHLDDGGAARMLAEMRRVCRPGGSLVLLEPLAPEPGDPWWRHRLARHERGEHFRGYPRLTELVQECLGGEAEAWREPARPFDLGLYRAVRGRTCGW